LGAYLRPPIDNSAMLQAQAVDNFITLLEQCPTFRDREAVMKRLGEITDEALNEARQVRRPWPEPTLLFALPDSSPREEAELLRHTKARARKAQEVIEHASDVNPLDVDTFRWDRKPDEFLEGWEWLEDVCVDFPPSGGFNIGEFVGGIASEPANLRMVPTRYAQRNCHSTFFRQIMMRLKCETSPPARDPISCFVGPGFTH
jgi:hypothetical protein